MEERGGREEGGGGGRGTAEKVMMEEEGNAEVESAAEEGNRVVKWEKLLSRMPVRVLLVEGDDSTRQIIAALLRKCSYRVAAASDGLKAWETLKEKHCNIDLVLTEVDLPSISGFGLLTMIMDHENCKNIPVIMMSSHDSMSMVFKCMLKGAADFLVKPIRKNELRNLWQHVWRRQLTFGGHDVHGHQDENEIYRLNAGVGKNIHSCDDAADKECSAQDSDAQSSCTRSEMETESTDKQKVLNAKLQNLRMINLEDVIVENEIEHMQLQSASVIQKTEAKVTAVTNTDMLSKHFVDDVAGEHHSKRRKTTKEAANLLNMFENQQSFEDATADNIAYKSGFCGIVKANSNKNDSMGDSSHVPQLELTLRRCEESSWSRKEKDATRPLNHSNSSAFSRYCSRSVEPNLLKPLNLTAQSKDFTSLSHNPQDQESAGASKCSSSRAHMTLEGSIAIAAGSAGEDGLTAQAAPFQVIPFSFPVGGMPIENLCSAYGPVVQPIFYQQSAHPLWGTVPSMWQDRAPYGNSSSQSEPESLTPAQDDDPDDQTVRTPSFFAVEKKDEHVAPLDEQRREPSMAADSTSASACSSGIIKCNSTQLPNFFGDTSGFLDSSNIMKESAGHGLLINGGIKPANFPYLSHREAALNKFRLKRKERCFKKKVRYQSRKVLAEQRPRVKGQFVRKEQLIPQSKPSDCSGVKLEPG